MGNKGTIFYELYHSPKEVLECLSLLAERNSLAAIHRTKGIKEETVMDWLRKAANHVEEIEALLLANYHLTRVQLDAMSGSSFCGLFKAAPGCSSAFVAAGARIPAAACGHRVWAGPSGSGCAVVWAGWLAC